MIHLLKSIITIFAFSLSFVYGQSANCIRINNSFKVGEKLTYKISYHWYALWFTAGEVDFLVKEKDLNNKPHYHFQGIGKTYKGYDWFFKVRDTYESFVDKETLLPTQFIRDVYEGGYTIYNNVKFDHEKHKAKSVKGTYDIPDCIQDVLSSIYYSRCIDYSKYEVNDTIPITIFLDDEVFPLYIRYLGKETIKTDMGKFNCIKFRPLLIEGTIFEGGEEMVVWASDDENKIPIKITTPIIVGEIDVELINYKGLKNRLSSRIK